MGIKNRENDQKNIKDKTVIKSRESVQKTSLSEKDRTDWFALFCYI